MYVSSGGSSYTHAYFGAGDGDIYLDDVYCVGTETSIVDCLMNRWGEHNCGHSEDAGCFCQRKIIQYILLILKKQLIQIDEIY